MKNSVYKKLYILSLLLIAVLVAGCQSEANGNAGEQTEVDDQANESEDTITIRFGHHDGEIDYQSTPWYAYTDTFKTYLEENSEGKVQVETYPNSQLGDLRSMTEQVSRGELEIVGGPNLGLLGSYTSAVEIESIPFLFENTEEASKVLNGKFGEELNEEIIQKSNIKVLSYLPTALRHFSTVDREIKSPEDLKGLKIRTQEIPIQILMMESWGGNPVALPYEELYSALQTNVIDGQENTIYNMTTAKIEEVMNYVTLSGHLMNTTTVLINHDFLTQLSEENQQLIQEAADAASKELFTAVGERIDEDLKLFEELGIKITELSEEEKQKFRDMSQEPVLEELKKEVDQKWIDLLFDELEAVRNKN